MQRHRLGDAGVTHVYDLKADTSDRSRHHLEALQREATDILHSLFSASTGPSQSSSSRRPIPARRAPPTVDALARRWLGEHGRAE